MRRSQHYVRSAAGSEEHNQHQTPERKSDRKPRGSMRQKKDKLFDPKEFIVAECSEHDVEIFKQVFDFFDDDHDGMLTPLDLRKAIRDYGGYKPGRAFVYVAMSVFDANDGGEITFKEFVKLMTQRPCLTDTDEDIERIYTSFDDENKGYISEEDILRAAEELHEDLRLDEVRQMIRKCDPNGEGKIRPEAFVAFNKRRNFD